MSTLKLSDPWVILQNQVKCTIGKSPYVTVCDLVQITNGNFMLPIKAANDCIAKALSTVLPKEYNFGVVKVCPSISGPTVAKIIPCCNKCHTEKEIANAFCLALYGNPLFKGVILEPDNISCNKIIIIIAKDIIQFPADNIDDYCNNYLEVASDVFSMVLQNSFNLLNTINATFTTEDCCCLKNKCFYCCN